MKSFTKKNPRATVRGDASALEIFGLAISSAAAATYTSIDVPASNLTEMEGINDNGDVTGFFMPTAGGYFTGFLRTPDGTFTTFVVNHAEGTTPSEINTKGEIVGEWQTSYGFQGFLRKTDGTILTVDPRQAVGVTGPSETGALRINNAGTIG